MPKWKWHLLINSMLIIAWINFLLEYGFLSNYLLLIFLVFFSSFLSIFPDVDSSKSNIRDIFAVIFASVAIFFIISNLSVGILLLLFCFIFLYNFFKFFPTKHRGITHKFWFSLLVSLVLVFMLWVIFSFSSTEFALYFLFVFSGYFSHIFLDKIF